MNEATYTASTADAAHCCICGGSHTRTLYELDEFRVVRCLGCGLVSLAVSPDRRAIEDMYGQEYFSERKEYFFDESAQEETKDLIEASHRNFSEGLSLISQYAPGRRLLDFGCAVGKFLSLAKAGGWHVTGVDISDFAVSHCRRALGLDAYCGPLNEIAFPSEEFDVVTMWDVIEHLADPVAELREVNRILRPGGVVLIDTPNEDSLLRSLARIIYSSTGGFAKYPIKKLYHRFHLYYFNRTTLRKSFEKSGFEIIHMTSRPIPDVKGRARAVERLLVDTISIPERALGRGYELVAVARKSNGTR